MNFRELAAMLLEWYDRMRRNLPWRESRDPYRIWVSEVMLQQTRVDTVIPYYHRFMQRFPDMNALAGASEEELLEEWQGLGYYSRARRLQQGVREVIARYGGKTPMSRGELLALPGVGDYTAGAILSIAHEQPEPAIDGNVSRVFSRLLHIDEPIERIRSRRQVERAVKSLFESNSHYGDITQALMELGALVCTPRNPHCEECPWAGDCLAFLRRDQQTLPVKAFTKPPLQVKVYAGILPVREKVLIVKRPSKGLLAGMWEFPSVEVAPSETEERGLEALTRRFCGLEQNVVVGREWRRLTHVFSHREWKLQVFFCSGADADFSPLSEALWVERQELGKVIWAGPYRKIAAWLMAEPACDWERGFENRCQ